MSYLVLARKYRPQTFQQVVGQEVAATGLKNAIEQNRVGQAFLFSGPRGVGKTSMARILAKALNCEKGPTIEPCGKCEICKGIESGRDADIQEIDAATYSKVENIRDLRETIPYSTLRARFKVLIVDEVHRLSAAAFDAFLKILEEPPAHVKFIFATTELRKVPETIISRCQLYEFRSIEENQIVDALSAICKKEKVKAEESLLRAIARDAQGGLRDSLTLLDQLISYAGNQPTLEDLRKASGIASRDFLYELIESVLSADRKFILEKLDALCDEGGGEEAFLSQLIDFLRQSLLLRACGKESELISIPKEEREKFSQISQRISPDILERWLTLLLAAKEKAGYLGGEVRALTELALLRMARVQESLPVAEILERLSALERKLSTGSSKSDELPVREIQPRAPSRPVPNAPNATVSLDKFLDALEKDRRSLADLLRRKGQASLWEGNAYRIEISGLSAIEKSMLSDAKNLKAAEKLLCEMLGRNVSLSVETVAELKTAPRETGAASGPLMKRALELFEGKVVEE